jgi:hypothetical protein
MHGPPTLRILILSALELSLDKLEVDDMFDGNVSDDEDQLRQRE